MRLLWYDVCGENARGKVSTEEIVAGLVWMILCLYVAAFLQVIVHEGGTSGLRASEWIQISSSA